LSKPKSNSVLDALPENQRAQLESWLFEENISYNDASARLLADFNVRSAPSSIGEWYRRTQQQRMLREIRESREFANQTVTEFQKNPADMYAALVNMVGQIAFESSMDGKKFDAETIFNFTKLVMTARKQELSAQTLALAKEKFQFDAAKAALLEVGKLKSIASKPNLNEKEKIKQIRLALFGSAPE
jgi:Protein of unknown function (DUF3486)